MATLLTRWKRLYRNDHVVLVVVALDEETFDTACNDIEGVSAILWDRPARSYSRVADSKMGVASYLSQQGYHQLFIELDVFCRASPLSVSIAALGEYPSADLAVPGHADVQSRINIGMYYVRPSPEATKFFDLVTEILRPSLTEKQHLTKEGSKLSYFDQGIFQACLQMSSQGITTEYYALDDTSRSTNLLQPCYGHNLRYALISNLYVSSYQPPTVYDSTICVHPLNNQPFSSFETKRATAKFLGFDPVDALRDVDETRRPVLLLKTLSGDLTVTDSPDAMRFFGGDFHKPEILQRVVQYPLAAMIHLSLLTNRTLVLPRHVRNTNTKAFPLHSLVNTASVEAMGVSWRYLTIEEARQLEDDTTAVSIRQQSTLSDAAASVAAACSSNNSVHVSRVCSLNGMETLLSSLYLSSEDSTTSTTTADWKQILDPIVEKLTWCLTPPSGPLFSFSMGAGHMEQPCTG